MEVSVPFSSRNKSRRGSGNKQVDDGDLLHKIGDDEATG